MYTQVISDVIEWVDPPKSPRWRAAALEKSGTLSAEAPLVKGGWGDLQEFRLESEMCVYTVALTRGTLSAEAPPLFLAKRRASVGVGGISSGFALNLRFVCTP
ncbi:MAG: hypothetical protein KME16_10970 [Scytolyngbya sp. HA4215-MV1]|nr:hypothetical protein [Scytolyngbya sp. HA4215-MV1]